MSNKWRKSNVRRSISGAVVVGPDGKHGDIVDCKLLRHTPLPPDNVWIGRVH
jgi:hypothetical protein